MTSPSANLSGPKNTVVNFFGAGAGGDAKAPLLNFGSSAYKLENGNWQVDNARRLNAEKITPTAILLALSNASNDMRFVAGVDSKGVPLVRDKNQIDQLFSGNNRIFTVNSKNQILQAGVVLKQNAVGSYLLSKLIDQKSAEIRAFNDLLVRLNKFADEFMAKTDDKGKSNKEKMDEDGKVLFPEKKSADGFDPADMKNNYGHLIRKYADMDTSVPPGKLWQEKWNFDQWYAEIYPSTFKNAAETIRNIIRERSTQTEQLNVDFSTINSKYNSVTEAMSSFIKSHYTMLLGFAR